MENQKGISRKKNLLNIWQKKVRVGFNIYENILDTLYIRGTFGKFLAWSYISGYLSKEELTKYMTEEGESPF